MLMEKSYIFLWLVLVSTTYLDSSNIEAYLMHVKLGKKMDQNNLFTQHKTLRAIIKLLGIDCVTYDPLRGLLVGIQHHQPPVLPRRHDHFVPHPQTRAGA